MAAPHSLWLKTPAGCGPAHLQPWNRQQPFVIIPMSLCTGCTGFSIVKCTGLLSHQGWRAEADRDTERGRRSRTAWRNGDAPLAAAPSPLRCGDAAASTCEDARDPEGRAQGCGRLACDDARGPGAAVFCFVPHVKYLAELARFTGVRIFEEGHCALERQFRPPEK